MQSVEKAANRDEMLQAAKQRAGELDEGFEIPAHWGELLELDEDGGEFFGRYLGKDVDKSKDPPREVFLFLDENGERCWSRYYFRLGQEMADVGIGDLVAIYRGADVPFTTKSGEERTTYRFAVVSQPCADPLPGDDPAEQSPEDEFGF
jgi:hypothetical protein